MSTVNPCSRYSRSCISIGVLLLLFSAAALSANPWSFEFRQWRATEAENFEPEDSTEIERRQFRLSYLWSRDQVDTIFSYDQQPVLIRDGSPAHNGYFHLLDLSFCLCKGPTRLESTTGIHGSSNMFKHVDFHNEALVSTFSIIHILVDDAVLVGINGDYRFGHFRLYPRVSLSTELSKGSKITLDLPIALLWQKNRWRFGITRYGEKWAALDSERSKESAFYLNEWRLGGQWQVPLSGVVDLVLGAGISFDTQVHYLDLVQGWLDEDLESAVFVELGINF